MQLPPRVRGRGAKMGTSALPRPGAIDGNDQLQGMRPFQRWPDHPQTRDEWAGVDGIRADLEETPLKVASGKAPAAGVVIEEPDGRSHQRRGFSLAMKWPI